MAETSVATAEVTGAVSQAWAANPQLSYQQVIEIVKSTGADLGSIQSGAKVSQVVNKAEQQNLAEAAVQIQQLLEKLDKSYPVNITAGTMVNATEAIKQIEANPTFMVRNEQLSQDFALACAGVGAESVNGYLQLQSNFDSLKQERDELNKECESLTKDLNEALSSNAILQNRLDTLRASHFKASNSRLRMLNSILYAIDSKRKKALFPTYKSKYPSGV
jgi:hypothetical protein